MILGQFELFLFVCFGEGHSDEKSLSVALKHGDNSHSFF